MLSLLGKVYSLGRTDYGRLGLGKEAEEKSEPTPVLGLEPTVNVGCGASVSFAVTKEGEVASEGSAFCFFSFLQPQFPS